ncbi:MAG: SpoIID/LytB domain-containing protein [Clostridia bacterium]|nr:SpoIID/LytB domain-containing protein [Clostridia bacterium]
MRQIFCLIMAVLMLLGVLAAVIPYVSAVDLPPNTEDSYISNEAVPTQTDNQTEKEPDNGLLLRIGLQYGSGVHTSFAVRAEFGFSLGIVKKDNVYTVLYETEEPHIAVCKDGNLALDNDGYYVLSSQNVVIGGYHLELPTAYSTKDEIMEAVQTVNQKLADANIRSSLIYAFPAYHSGMFYIRIGDFGSMDSANSKADIVAAAVNEPPTAVIPMTDALTVLAPDKNLILMEFQANDGLLGAAPLQKENTDTVIITPAKNGYRGVFLFGNYNSGISVTNLISLEEYVAGVLPYEINRNWSYEAIKAFACIVRSYTLSNRTKHTSLGIDLCNSTDCQVYKGVGLQNEAILRAVEETRGLVITYGNEICSTVYSAVTGGCTVNVEQIWNGSAFPYLRAVETPWEDYASHPNGVWMAEVSPGDLYTYLANTKGYTQLKSSITDISIVELAENSSYVYKLAITDSQGNTVTLRGTDVIRTTLGKYLNSANFVVGYRGEIPILNKYVSVITESGTQALYIDRTENRKTVQVMTANGIVETDITDGLPVLQGDGSTTLLTDEKAVYDIPADALQRLNDPTNGNFLFIGKGWGHGGGISQWGAKNMAENGAYYDEIIHAYFTDVKIRNYKELLQTN